MNDTIRHDGPSTDKRTEELHLLVAIPALNEEMTVGNVIRSIPREMPGIGSIEVLVVDDGSSDGTAAIAAAEGARVIRHAATTGVGGAFHTALAFGIDRGSDLIVTIDADGQFDPADIPALIAPVLSSAADFTTASRFKDPALVPRMSWIKLQGNRMMSRLISRFTGQKFYDVSCGMRCYGRQAALRLHLLAPFTYTQEVFLNLAFKQMRIVEVPLRVRGKRPLGRSRVADNLWRYGYRTAKIIFRSYRDYFPMRFFGSLALVLMAPASALGLFVLIYYLQTGSFSPYKWAAFTAAALAGIALMLGQIGMIGDMLNRHRIYLEEILYRQRSSVRSDRRAERLLSE